MEKVLVFSLLVLASLRPASTEEKSIKEGGSVTLELRPRPSDPITIIQWKFKDSILAEWVKDVLPLALNRGNIKLDKVTGRLTMEKMTKADEGVYSVEVNNNVQEERYNVVFINDVPKPKIWISPLKCSDADDKCTLNCEGDTTGAEPVTYSWKTDNGEWNESRRDMLITKKEHGQVKTFTCKMKNPVSEKESDPLQNRLYKKKEPKSSPVGWIVGVIVALIVAVGVWMFFAKKKKKWPFGMRNVDPESPANNGNVHANDANEGLLNKISMTNTSPGSQEGHAGGAQPPNPPPEGTPSNPPPEGTPSNPPPEGTPSNPPHEKEPVSKNELTGEPADPLKAPREENAAAEGEADAYL